MSETASRRRRAIRCRPAGDERLDAPERGGVDLEIHQYVEPLAKEHEPMKHSDIGSMHFMLKVTGIEGVVAKVEELGYSMMTPGVEPDALPGFKYAYFRGPDGMMVELQEGSYL
jgi:hypothetical protein